MARSGTKPDNAPSILNLFVCTLHTCAMTRQKSSPWPTRSLLLGFTLGFFLLASFQPILCLWLDRAWNIASLTLGRWTSPFYITARCWERTFRSPPMESSCFGLIPRNIYTLHFFMPQITIFPPQIVSPENVSPFYLTFSILQTNSPLQPIKNLKEKSIQLKNFFLSTCVLLFFFFSHKNSYKNVPFYEKSFLNTSLNNNDL